jgi:hypothetical protein
MSFEKVISVDRIEIIENGCVNVRTKTAIVEDGNIIASHFHRHVVSPGDTYSKEEALVQSICAATHTREVIEAHRLALVEAGV